jgi:hypothetical protein
VAAAPEISSVTGSSAVWRPARARSAALRSPPLRSSFRNTAPAQIVSSRRLDAGNEPAAVRVLRLLRQHLVDGAGADDRVGLVDLVLTEWSARAPDALGQSFERAARSFALTDPERDAFALAVAVELDGRVSRAVAGCPESGGAGAPTVGLLTALARHQQPISAAAFVRSPLVEHALVELRGDGLLHERTLRVLPGVLARLAGAAGGGLDPFPPAPELLASLIVGPETRERVEAWAAAPHRPLILAGRPGSGRTTLARAAAGRAQVPLVVAYLEAANRDPTLTLRAARRDARWHGAALLVIGEQSLDWSWFWREAPPSTILVTSAELLDQATARAPAAPIFLSVDEPDEPTRAALLMRAIGRSDAAVEGLARRFRFNPGRLMAAVRTIEGKLTATTLAGALRGLTPAGPAVRVVPPAGDDHELLLPSSTAADLDLACARIRNGRGAGLLFQGPSGTGKTLAARTLAQRLDMDLLGLQGDLAAAFDAVGALGGILLVEEPTAAQARALPAYLDATGLPCIVTATSREHLDDALLRRLSHFIAFPDPDEAMSRRLWLRLAPDLAEHDLAALSRLPRTPAEIRDAYDAACAHAVERGVELSALHLLQAAQRAVHRPRSAGEGDGPLWMPDRR